MSENAEDLPLGEFQMMITAYRCRCGNVWTSRHLDAPERPRTCPKCKSANWDKRKKFERKKPEEET